MRLADLGPLRFCCVLAQGTSTTRIASRGDTGTVELRHPIHLYTNGREGSDVTRHRDWHCRHSLQQQCFLQSACARGTRRHRLHLWALAILVVLPPGRKPSRAQLSQKHAGHGLCHWQPPRATSYHPWGARPPWFKLQWF